MFSWFKKSTKAPAPSLAPEVLGLRLGGAIELDPLKLKLIEPFLTIEQAACSQIIKAVGEVRLDEQTRLLRFYTDDDGFIQVLQSGTTDADVSDVTLFYFYESKPIDSDALWDQWLESKIVQPTWALNDKHYQKLWDNSRPVAMTEKTWNENGSISTTDQFVMLYERQASDDVFESLLVSAEENFNNQQAERAIIFSTGVSLSPTDFTFVG